MIPFGQLLKAGGAMAMNARTIGRLTLGEFAVQLAGWQAANGMDTGPRAPTQEQFDAADWNF